MPRLITRGLVATMLAVGVVAGTPSAAAAADPTTTTENGHNVIRVFVDEIPICAEGGPRYEVTITFNEVFHVTDFGDGRLHVTGTQTGDLTAVPLEAGQPNATGTFTTWFGLNINGDAVNGTSTLSVRGEFETGSKINTHVLEHFNETPTGAEFFFERCHD